MQTIPKELVAHIGTFLLSHKDRVHCLETAHMFKTITQNHQSHLLTFKDSDIRFNERIARIPQTLRYIHRIKPHLRRLVLVFVQDHHHTNEYHTSEFYDTQSCIQTSFDNLATCEHLKGAFKDVTVKIEIKYWQSSLISVILDGFMKTREHIGWTVQPDVTHMTANGDEPWMKHVHTLTTRVWNYDMQPKVLEKCAHIPSLCLYCETYTSPIDLSHIDTSTNKNLLLALSGYDVEYIHISKVTLIQIFKESRIYTSFAQHMKQSIQDTGIFRVEEIIIECFANIYQRSWKLFLDSIPQTVLWRVQVTTPFALWYIDEMLNAGIPSQKIQFQCNSRETWIIARFIKLTIPKLAPCKIVISQNFTGDDRLHAMDGLENATASDLYAAMPFDCQVMWHGVAMASGVL